MDGHPLGATGRLIDSVGLLTDQELNGLSAVLGPVLADCQAEFIVYIVDSVPGRQFREHAMASRRKLARDQSTSLILVMALKDRHAEIATAPQFADRFTPATSAELLKASLVPMMRRGRIREAIVGAVKAMRELLRRVGGQGAASGWPPRGGAPRVGPRLSPLKGFLAFLTVVLSLFVAICILGPIRSCRQEHACRHCGKWCSITTKVLKNATYSATGMCQRDYACTGCRTNYSIVEVLPVLTSSSSDSSSSGSDSSSGGSDSGGSDGGGGADW